MSIKLTFTILIVDDSPSELEIMKNYLHDHGYNVITANNGKEALEKTSTTIPDAIITDIIMPEMSGFELCRSIKRNPQTQNIPIIICSSKNQEIDKFWGIKQGADIYITKPYTREQLLDAIQSIAILN